MQAAATRTVVGRNDVSGIAGAATAAAAHSGDTHWG